MLFRSRKKIEKQLKKGKITDEEAAVKVAEVVAPVAEQAPAVPVETTDDLLREIRDLLKAKQSGGESVNENKQ